MRLKVANVWRYLLLFAVIVSSSKPALGAFRRMPITAKKQCNLTLSSASGIPHTCWQLQNLEASLPVWQSALTFEFGRLSRSQWQHLNQTYGRWQKRRLTPYDAQRHYTLMDFMPPLMQALNLHQFHAEQVTLPPPLVNVAEQTSIASVIANCWGTVYEILRAAQSHHTDFYTFMVGREQVGAWLQQGTAPVRGRTQPGDVLLIKHQLGDRTYLDHVALMVDDQIFFEKAGTGDNTPYRLVDLETLKQSWRPDIFTFEVRRPVSGQPLQSPLERFGLHSSEPLEQFPALANVSRALAAQFSVVWFHEQESLSLYYYRIEPITLQELRSGS